MNGYSPCNLNPTEFHSVISFGMEKLSAPHGTLTVKHSRTNKGFHVKYQATGRNLIVPCTGQYRIGSTPATYSPKFSGIPKVPQSCRFECTNCNLLSISYRSEEKAPCARYVMCSTFRAIIDTLQCMTKMKMHGWRMIDYCSRAGPQSVDAASGGDR
jgi:hypothetical protein